MKIEIFVLCDAATDSHGKLNILGTFDQIYASKLPVIHPACAVALRIRFNKMEEGIHKIGLQLVNPDGHPIFQAMEGEVHPQMGPDIDSVAVNLILNFQGLQFDAFDDYQINLFLDGQNEASLPLHIRKLTKPK